jgi:CheY-like chemotaxis protein/HPt (histidine-containing phosphotransfer) domain-containing protein
LELPKVLGDATLVHRTESKETTLYAPNAHVLVVDDNQINLNVATGLLETYRIQVDSALSGKQAMEMIEKKAYDLVFMDHMMPEMTGVEATIKIREAGYALPIVALTASAVVGAREMMLKAGMDDYLAKPVVKLELRQVLRNWLPPEKLLEPPQEVVALAEPVDEKSQKFWLRVEQISGLSLAEGLDRVDGHRAFYEKVLRLLMNENNRVIKNINDCFKARDLASFRIEIHGLKGALANVGARELSAKAYELEIASVKGNMEFCQERLPGFAEEITRLSAELAEAFALISPSDEPLVIPPELPPILRSLTEAFAEMDLVGIEAKLEELYSLELTGAIKEEVEQISDMILMMDYDAATERIQKLLESG